MLIFDQYFLQKRVQLQLGKGPCCSSQGQLTFHLKNQSCVNILKMTYSNNKKTKHVICPTSCNNMAQIASRYLKEFFCGQLRWSTLCITVQCDIITKLLPIKIYAATRGKFTKFTFCFNSEEERVIFLSLSERCNGASADGGRIFDTSYLARSNSAAVSRRLRAAGCSDRKFPSFLQPTSGECRSSTIRTEPRSTRGLSFLFRVLSSRLTSTSGGHAGAQGLSRRWLAVGRRLIGRRLSPPAGETTATSRHNSSITSKLFGFSGD